MNNRQKTGLYYPIKSKEIREWKGAEKLKNTLKLYFPCYQEKKQKCLPFTLKYHQTYLTSATYPFQDQNDKFPHSETFYHFYLLIIVSNSWLISTGAARWIRKGRTRYKMSFVHQKWTQMPKSSHPEIAGTVAGVGCLRTNTQGSPWWGIYNSLLHTLVSGI